MRARSARAHELQQSALDYRKTVAEELSRESPEAATLPMSFLSFIGQGTQLGRYVSSSCGDALLFNVNGSATFNGKLETTQSEQAFLTFSWTPLATSPI